MMLSQQLTMLTDLTQLIIHALETNNHPLAQHTAKKLERLTHDLNKSLYMLIAEELRHLPH